MVGQGIHVLARKGIHHPRNRGLPGARLRPHRLLRGRYRRAARLDGATHRDRRPDASVAAGRAAAAPCRKPARGRRGGLPAAHRQSEDDETSPPYQDRRHARSRFLRPRDHRAAVRGRRRRVSHQHEPHVARDACASWSSIIRSVERDHGRPIGILVDLQGPKLRLGTFAGGSVMVNKGESFTLDSNPAPGDASRVLSAASGNPEVRRARPDAAARRRQGAAASAPRPRRDD